LRSGLTNEVRPGGPGTALGPGFGGAGFGAAGAFVPLSAGPVSALPGVGSACFSGSAVRAVGSCSAAVFAPSSVEAAFCLLVVFLAGFCFPVGGDAAYASFSRRTTGASTVDEADRTNSPIS